MDEILRYFPNKIYQIFSNLLQENPQIGNELQEIRIRVDKPIILKLNIADINTSAINNDMYFFKIFLFIRIITSYFMYCISEWIIFAASALSALPCGLKLPSSYPDIIPDS